MTEELYLSDADGKNWQQVDLSYPAGITLNYNSNFFEDIGKISSNTSYTIRLPKTSRNCRIIEAGHMISSMGEYPRRLHFARYYRNGVEIISSACVYLMKITGSAIEIVLIWGNLNNLERLKEEEKTLNELVTELGDKRLNIDSGVNWEYNKWDKYDSNAEKACINTKMDFGLGVGKENSICHPAIRVYQILELIAFNSGLNFNYPPDKEDFLKRLLIPCYTKKGGDINYIHSQTEFRMTNEREDDEKHEYVLFENISGNETFFEFEPESRVFNSKGSVSYKIILNCSTNTPLELYFPAAMDGEEIKYEKGDEEYPYKYNQEWTITPTRASISFCFRKNKNVVFAAKGEPLKLQGMPATVEYGMPFSGINNLPDMKQTDFLISVCAIAGMFATVGGINTVNFVTFDSLIENKENALNWSSKLVKEGEWVPKELSFSLDGFAQKNYFRYKEQEKSSASSGRASSGNNGSNSSASDDGVLDIKNSFLEKEKDIVTVAFSTTSSVSANDNTAYIPFYSLENGLPVLNTDISYRIVREEKDSSGNSMATFKNMGFQDLLKENYHSYSKVVSQPVYIKEDFILNEMDLKNLDYRIPVFLSQYGAYFAIMRIQANGSGVCECELIKI